MESYIGWILLVPPIAVLLMPWASRAGKWAANTLAIAATGLLLFFTLRLIPAIGTRTEVRVITEPGSPWIASVSCSWWWSTRLRSHA